MQSVMINFTVGITVTN